MPVSGRVTGIATDPNNPSTIYIAAAGGGVWKTTDGGTNWAPQTDHVTDGSGNPVVEFMGAIALGVNPNNTSQQVLYAGTGEANNSAFFNTSSDDSYYGEGILVSTNGGSTWTLTGQSQFTGMGISRIAVDPQNPNVAYAAVNQFTANGTAGTTGIYKTTNAGGTWTNMTGAIDTTHTWSDVVIDPSTSGATAVLFAAVGDVNTGTNNGVYESINGGASWFHVPGGKTGLPSGPTVGRISLAIAHPVGAATATVYASMAAPTVNGGLLELARSTNTGATWTDQTAKLGGHNYLGGQAATTTSSRSTPPTPTWSSSPASWLTRGSRPTTAVESSSRRTAA
jgi:hypothetical protein